MRLLILYLVGLIKEINTHGSIVPVHSLTCNPSKNRHLLLPSQQTARASTRSSKYKTQSIGTNYRNSSRHEAKSRTNPRYVGSTYEVYASWSHNTANLHILSNSWLWTATMPCFIWRSVIRRGRRGSSWRRRSSIRPHCLFWRTCHIMCCTSFSLGRGIRRVSWLCIAWRLFQPTGVLGFGYVKSCIESAGMDSWTFCSRNSQARTTPYHSSVSGTLTSGSINPRPGANSAISSNTQCTCASTSKPTSSSHLILNPQFTWSTPCARRQCWSRM